MNLLALDCSTERLSLALSTAGRVYAYDEAVGQRHSETILAQIAALLREADLAKSDLDAIAFGAGPGSFTGLRIACGVTQGLALALDIPVLGVTTLQAMAEASGAARVVACLDARMGEVYHAAYSKAQNEWSEVNAPALFSPHAVPLPSGSGWIGCGNAFGVYGEVLGARLGEHLESQLKTIYPTANAIAAIARPRLERGEGGAAASALPLYIRDKVALRTDER